MALTKEQGRYIEQTFKAMQRQLHAYALSVLKDDFQAEEAVQEAFCVACKKPEDMLASPNPQGWIMMALKNELKTVTRRNAMLKKYFVAARDTDVAQAQDFHSQVDNNVNLMYADLVRDEEFYLVKQVILEKRTLLDMAEELDISTEACKKRFQRAEKRLREEIAKIDKLCVP